MKNVNTIITLAIVSALIPFFGIPRTWKDILVTIICLLIAAITYVSSRNKSKADKTSSEVNIIDNQ